MKITSFEDFLKEEHGKTYLGTDDAMPEAFDSWLAELDGEDYMSFGELYGESIKAEMEEKADSFNEINR